MSFTPSIGDVVMMAQIAWKLAQAFTKGRKSAPAEFCEVENQLYSLSAALEAIRGAQERGDLEIGHINPKSISSAGKDESHSENTVKNILQNCLKTLTHLENIVKKYSVIRQPTTSSHGIGNWSQHVARNWRKIEWTTEKGDLNALRGQIMIHTNSLNLLLGVATSSQAAGIRKSVETSSAMIKELYEWYEDNVKGLKIVGNSESVPSPPAYMPTEASHTFELSIRTARGKEIVCPRAYFNRDWDQISFTDSMYSDVEPMLACACRNHGNQGLHQPAVQRYTLSRITFPARLAGERRSWILFKISDKVTNQLVTLYITAIHRSYIQTLEEAILQDLAIRRADAILEQGSGNGLCYLSADTGEERVIASIGELRTAQKSIESITFNYGGRTYSRKYVDNFQILQYQTLSLDSLTKGIQEEPLKPLDYAEVFITYGGQDEEAQSDVVNNTLHLKRNTQLKLDDGHALIRIDAIEAIGTLKDKRTSCLGDVGITVQLTSRQAARELHERLEDMRMELFIRSLQYPRTDESVALRLQFVNITCEYMCIPDANVTVTIDAQGKRRLIIESRNKCTLVSQVLADNFSDSLSGKPDYTRPTYVVQYDESGTRSVYRYERGFRYLDLGGQQADRMFKLAWDTTSMELQTAGIRLD
ncbi:uncharacterized protein GGS22DRAFT_89380 [Annulohypoxylon maeteangense]|uniref:uncharacterized protein n=1 Tax=Annulohypoxylon maeteangense TaxID=1927788 RepID=UPI0020084EA8|nr:uncharacterized protein GGS22DRAFT_89380 [Annulohypoxylon maeteangense]KAI0887809.1 hypothetical protein GGS22DRAFT_89380 [Annulohypoxylon maeteangense]